MKLRYEGVELEIIYFEGDVITESNPESNPESTPDENEGPLNDEF